MHFLLGYYCFIQLPLHLQHLMYIFTVNVDEGTAYLAFLVMHTGSDLYFTSEDHVVTRVLFATTLEGP